MTTNCALTGSSERIQHRHQQASHGTRPKSEPRTTRRGKRMRARQSSLQSTRPRTRRSKAVETEVTLSTAIEARISAATEMKIRAIAAGPTTNVTNATATSPASATATSPASAPPPPADPEWGSRNRASMVTNADSVTSACGVTARITLQRNALTGRKPKLMPPTQNSTCDLPYDGHQQGRESPSASIRIPPARGALVAAPYQHQTRAEA